MDWNLCPSVVIWRRRNCFKYVLPTDMSKILASLGRNPSFTPFILSWALLHHRFAINGEWAARHDKLKAQLKCSGFLSQLLGRCPELKGSHMFSQFSFKFGSAKCFSNSIWDNTRKPNTAQIVNCFKCKVGSGFCEEWLNESMQLRAVKVTLESN